MTKQERLLLIHEAVENNVYDVHDLVDLMELSVEDILKYMSKKLLEMEHKFIIEYRDDDYLTEEEQEEVDQAALDLVPKGFQLLTKNCSSEDEQVEGEGEDE